MKTLIQKVSLRGFKSFNRKVELAFHPGLNCIIGPNGAGKSNIIDGLCFLLGRLSSKDLRAENFADLLFKRKTAVASEGEVSLILDNSAKAFPFDSKEIEIKRKIKKTGQTQFKINGKNATRHQVLELLSHARIYPDGHNIILQGDIAKFVDLRPNERRSLIEEIAGITLYEEKKRKAVLELQKVEERLKEVQIILKEKEAYMKNLEEEKKGAERYRELQRELSEYQAGELALRQRYAKEKRDKAAKEIEGRVLNIENTKLELEISGKKIAQTKKELERLEREIQKKGGEDSLQLQKEVEDVRVRLEKARTLIATSVNEIERIEKRKQDLEKSLASVKQKLKDKEGEISKIKTQLSSIAKAEDSLKKGSAADLKTLEADFNKLEKAIETAKEKKEKLISQSHELKAKIKIRESELNLINERLAQLSSTTKEFSKAKAQQQKLLKELNPLTQQDSKLALELGELKKKIIKKEEQLTRCRILARGSQEALLRDTALRTLRGKSGVLGTVAELGHAKPQYAKALSVAAGNRTRNIVVDKLNTAIACLQLLKSNKAGVATFLPLDKLRAPSSAIPASALKKPGVLGLANELIECEAKYKKIFRYVFRDTLVVKNVAAAKALGVGKYRMVTLDGDIFESSGAITGGFRRTAVGFESVPKEHIDKLELEVRKLNETFSKLQKDREALEERIFKLRQAKAEIDAKAQLSERGKLAESADALRKRKAQLENSVSTLTSKLGNAESKIKILESELEERILKRNNFRVQLHELQFGSAAEKAEQIQKQKAEFEAALAAARATIENALLPERENIYRVLKELEKERGKFEKQISEEESRVKKLEKELEEKEGEQESFHSKLRALFEKQTELSANLRGEEVRYNKFLVEQSRLEREKNSFAIEKAQHEAELAAIEEELKQFAGIRPKKVKTLESAKAKMREIQAKLESLGSINMRALEIFEDVIKEHFELANKVSKLSREKDSVLQIIDEVEAKKKEAFMKTFNEINNHFSKIYEKVSAKYKGVLKLENEKEPFEGGVIVSLSDAKKKRVSLASLSGGEKVLMALAFIFAIQEHEPASFYLLDEIEAALDKVNSERVAKLLKEYSQKSQVLVISHNDAVISEADTLYGVSMNKEGESAIVSLKL